MVMLASELARGQAYSAVFAGQLVIANALICSRPLLTRLAPRVLQSMPTASLGASIRAPYGVGVGVAVGVGVGLTTTTVVEVLVPSLGNFL
jgi:hypothetical protein